MNADEQAAAYEPIFYHHANERWVPVHPSGFLTAANLWLARSRVELMRKDPGNWGRCRMPVLGNVPSTFQQGEPLIPRGSISVNAADELPDYPETHTGPYYLGHDEEGGSRNLDCCDRRYPYTQTTGQCENFLDVGGWQARADVVSPNPNAADYTQPGVERAQGIWSSPARANDLDVAFVEIVEARDALSSEIVSELRARFKVDALRVFLYYALFPIHEQAGLGSTRADYEGDWVCLAVVAEPAAEEASEAPPPVAVGYGSRRGVERSDSFRIRFSDAFQINTHEGHPKAFVADRIHNLHSQPGGDPGPVEEAVSEAVEEVKDRAEDALEDLDTTKDVLVVILKIVAGAGIGGWFGGPIGALVGAVVGAIAGAIEAAVSDPPDIDVGGGGPGGGGGPAGGGEQVPNSAFGVILTPQAVLATIPETGAATAVRPWRNDLTQRVVNRTSQPWWRESECLPGREEGPAYAGRWGVLCTDDPLERRSGMPFPDFLCTLDRSLLEELSTDPDA
jgi:hypothetical protein